MKILFINTVCGYGSTGRICTDIADLLINQGHECRIAYGRGEVPDKYKSISVKIGNSSEVKYHAAIARITDSAGFHSKRATQKLVSWIDEWTPDLIHLHNIHGYYIDVEVLFEFLKTVDIPIVWTFHDCWPYTGHCVYSDYIGCDRWKTGCYSCPKKKEYPGSLILDASKRNYERKKELFTGLDNLTIVTVSDWLKSQVEMSFMKNYEIVMIYNGIDKSVFKPTENTVKKDLGIEGTKLLLGVSDLWSERKGLSFFYRYAEEKHDNEAIVMVGFREDELPNVPSNIIAMARTDSVEKLVELYSAADIVLNPSFEETFGLVTAEALSCGTPVIVQNATACPELIDETCGKVIEKNDYQGMKVAISEILDKNISAENCLKRSELFNKEENYQQYIDLYRRTIKEEQYEK